MDNVDERVEAERLRHVRALIEDVLREHDVMASVVIAGRGRLENFQHVSASWSNVRSEQLPDGRLYLGLRSLARDYVDREDERRQHLAWSVGAVCGVGRLMGIAAMQWLEVAEKFTAGTGADNQPLERDDPRDESPPALP